MSYSYQITNGVLEKFLCDPDETDLKIEIPEGVKEIADRAFENCRSIKYVVLPSSLQRIGAYAFLNCTGLVTCTPHPLHPGHPDPLGEGAFSGCRGLQKFSLSPYGQIAKIPEKCFMGCASLQNFPIPETVTEIGSWAFGGCMNLEVPALPEGLTKMGSSAFTGCDSLFTVTIPQNLIEIPDYCFTECRRLNEVIIRNGVKKIGIWAFARCGELAIVHIPESMEKIEQGAFYESPKLFRVFMDSWKAEIGWPGNFDTPSLKEFFTGQASPYSVNPILVYLTGTEDHQHLVKNCYTDQQLFLEAPGDSKDKVIAVYTYFNLRKCHLGYLPQFLVDELLPTWECHKYLCYVYAKTLDKQGNFGLRVEVSELDPEIGGFDNTPDYGEYFEPAPPAARDLLYLQPPRRTDVREIR